MASAAAPATVQALERLASGSIPSRGGITACGPEPLHPWPGRPQARPSVDAPHRMRARRTAMTSVMILIPSCGGDMSSPQKRPSTRHDSSTASDNRRSARLASRVAWSLIARRRINLQRAAAKEWGRVPYITSMSMPFFDRSGSVHAARSKQQGRRLPDRSFEIPTSMRRSRV